MNRLVTTLLIAAASIVPVAAQPDASEPPPRSVGEALARGVPYVQLRYRLESVSEDSRVKDAIASTLRTVLGYRSANYKGFSVFAEAENVSVVGNDLYDNRGAAGLSNNVSDRPVVADPALTEINQAGVRYRNEDWSLTLGRQEIVLGDARHVGNVGWRQNHQSFDGLRIDNSSFDKVDVSYIFVDRVHRIFGDGLDLAAHLVRVSGDVGSTATLTVYGQLLDYRDLGAAANSTATYGVELAGKRPLTAETALLYEAEYATQSDYADNRNRIDAGYGFLSLGVSLPAVTVKLGWEVLEGSPADGRFATPLATLHKFNGWADKFLATPPAGLEDLYLQVGGKVRAFDWLVRYHDFGAESDSAAYGTELDAQLLYKAPCDLVLGLKAAIYDAERFSVDTEKLMVWAAHSF